MAVDSSGKERYLDALAYGWNDDTNYKEFYQDLPNILGYIEYRGFHPRQIEKVRNSLKRLEVLGLFPASDNLRTGVEADLTAPVLA